MTDRSYSPGHSPNAGQDGPKVAFVWMQYGPYHMDRCEAAAMALASRAGVIGIEIAPISVEYAWAATGAPLGFWKETLFPDAKVESVSPMRRFRRLLGRLLKLRAHHVFLCNADRPEIFLTAMTLRLLGRRVYVMTESKFDDKPRRLWREAAKRFYYLPYCGALVGGTRNADYMRFLGFPESSIATGYDAVGLERVRRLAGVAPAPGGTAFDRRHFTIVARLVAKKNLGLAIDAYRRYRELAGDTARDLVIFGSGHLESQLRGRAAGLEGLCFAGFHQQDGIARGLGTTLALILPSIEEQWGLVVNEALAMGVPVLVTDQVGARDSLVRVAVDGYLFEPDNAEGLAWLMHRIGGDEVEWRRLSEGTQIFAPQGDSPRFGDGVRALTGL